jgi:hypothetical protein
MHETLVLFVAFWFETCNFLRVLSHKKIKTFFNKKIRPIFRSLRKLYPNKIKPKIIFLHRRTKKVPNLKKMGAQCLQAMVHTFEEVHFSAF